MRQATAPLLTLRSLTKSFGSKPLFEDISLVLAKGERTALIGPNGSGKSTLCKILADAETPDGGEISVNKGARIAYVPQTDAFPDHMSVGGALRACLQGQERESEALLSIYSGKSGFTNRDQPVSELSGGWKKRLAITCGLIQEPDLLLLDEPTNHLDIQSILWLEEVLLELSCAVLFISHDRYFLERVAERVIELDRRYKKGFLSSDGSYSSFLETRTTYFEQVESYKDSLENKVRREVEWLRRGAKARTTKAKGRIKQAGELILELESMRTEANRASLLFAETGRETRELIKVTKIRRQRGERTFFSDFSVTLSPGTRLGIAGANGTGKTTLIKTLVGTEPPDKGTVKLAHRLKIAYFDQNRAALDLDQTLKQALCPEGDAVLFNGKELHVISWAKRFLFRSEQIQLPLRSLSGGERARVLLAQLMLQPADVLVLDEPTNDLDISTLEVLEETLNEFAGAVILVTHDRHFLDRVCTSVVGLDGKGHCSIYASYFQWELAEDELRNLPEKTSAEKTRADEIESKDLPPSKLTYAEQRELDQMEKEIGKCESAINEFQKDLESPEVATNAGLLQEKCDALSKAQGRLEDLYTRWQELDAKKSAYESRVRGGK